MPGDVILSDNDRSKLDGIVQKMQSNKETDEYIQAVINDFKGKYGTVPIRKTVQQTISDTSQPVVDFGQSVYKAQVQQQTPAPQIPVGGHAPQVAQPAPQPQLPPVQLPAKLGGDGNEQPLTFSGDQLMQNQIQQTGNMPTTNRYGQAIPLRMVNTAEGQNQNIVEGKQKLEQNPADVAAINQVGYGYTQIGDVTNAKNAFTQTLQQDPNNEVANQSMGSLNYNENDYQGAYNNYATALKVNPQNRSAALGMGQSLYQLSKTDPTKKEAYLNTSKAIIDHLASTDNGEFPTETNVWHMKGLIENSLGNETESGQAFDKANLSRALNTPLKTVYDDYLADKARDVTDPEAALKAIAGGIASFGGKAIESVLTTPPTLILSGLQDMYEGGKQIKKSILALPQNYNPNGSEFGQNDKDLLTGTAKVISGGLSTAFGTGMVVAPGGGAIFNAGISVGDDISAGNASKILMAPLTTFIPTEDPLGKELLGLGNVALSFAVLHAVNSGIGSLKGKEITQALDKIQKGENVTGQDVINLTNAVAAEAKPENANGIAQGLQNADTDNKGQAITEAAKVGAIKPETLSQMQGLSNEQQIKLAPLLEKYDEVKAEMDGLHETLKEPKKIELENLKQKISEIQNQPQAPAATETVPANDNAIKTEDNIQVKELLDKPVTYKGQKAELYQDGQSIIAKITGTNREVELGNIDEIGNKNITDLGIEQENSVVNSNDKGNIEVRGKEYVNNFSDPLAAINKDAEGNVVSVNLEAADGDKRTFRGQVAQDIAYQIHLNELDKRNERPELEQFINNDEPTATAVNNGQPPEITQTPADEDNGQIQRTKAESGTGENSGTAQGGASTESIDNTPSGTNEPANTEIIPDKVQEDLPDQRLSGISHEALQDEANELGIEAPDRGIGTTPEQEIARGRELLDKGDDPQKAVEDFNKDKKISADSIALVRAEKERLLKEVYKAVDDFGENSKEDNAAKKKLEDWNKAIKPMATVWNAIGEGLQGKTDIDTGSFVGLRNAFKEQTGKDLTPMQKVRAKELSGQVKDLTNQVEDLKNKVTELLDREIGLKETKGSVAKKAKVLADRIREYKTKPIKFVDAQGNEITLKANSIIDINDIIEGIAKAVEAGGKLADAINGGIDRLKELDWYKALSDSDKEAVSKQFEDALPSESKEKEQAKIDRLQKSLDDISKGDIKEAKKKATDSPQAKELRTRIAEAKKNLGLISSKESPTDTFRNEEENRISLQQQFADKADNKFTPEEVKGIWSYAKDNYVDNSHGDFDDMISGVSKDIGLSPEQVRSAIAQPKGAKKLTDEMYRTQSKRNEAISKAKTWLRNTANTKFGRFLNALPSVFFGAKTFGHGTVAAITHAGMNIFRPTAWGKYFPMFADQFKYFTSEATHEQAMQDMMRDPLYIKSKRDGLSVDPHKNIDDYEKYASFFGRVGAMGNRGFDALKPYRLDMYKSILSHASETELSDPTFGKAVAELVNNHTGVANIGILPNSLAGKVVNSSFFAPKLVASQWARLIKEPIQAVQTITKMAIGKEVTPAEKAIAKIWAYRSGEMMGTYFGLLAANQGLLKATGSKDDINIAKPWVSDWLKFKVAGHTVDVSAGMLPTFTFMSRLALAAVEPQGDLPASAHKSRGNAMEDAISTYFTGKFSPILSTAKDVVTQHTYDKNVMPFSNDKPTKGHEQISLWRYIAQYQSPIPVSDAYKNIEESMKEKGMSQPQIDDILNGFLIGVITGGTGAKISENPKDNHKTTDPEQTFQQTHPGL